MKSAGIYIHVPFCKKKCDYCNFYSVPIKNNDQFKKLKNKYLEVLSGHIIKSKQFANDTYFDTVYLGGGTPSNLSLNEIKYVLNTLKNNYNIAADCEVTIECNPDTINRNLIKEYKNIGINRITLGIQTLDHNAHLLIGRKSSLPKIDIIKEIADINGIILAVDLICGIPGLNNKEYLNSLSEIIKFNVEHISIYMLSIENGTLLDKRLNYSNGLEIFQKKQFEDIIEFLVKAGYEHYEVSNFAKNGYYSKHNLKYWQYESYLGFGPGAHSFFHNKRWAYPEDIYQYIKNKENNIIEDNRSVNSMYAEFFMTGLRLKAGVSGRKFFDIFNADIPDTILNKLEFFEKEGLVSIKSENNQNIFFITKKGFFLTDSIIYDIVKDIL